MSRERSPEKLKTTGLGIKLKQNYEVLDSKSATDLSYKIASANIRVIESILEERRTKTPEECRLIERILSQRKKFEGCIEK
jgi:hypothetical protein